MEYERWEEDIFDFEFDGRGYRFEPEYTEEELRQMDLEMQARGTEGPEAVTTEVSRVSGSWWCTCGKCKQMPTEQESRCCKEWDLLVTSGMASLNVSVEETGEETDEEADEEADESPACITENEVRQLLNKPVLETFFWVPKINWKKRPVPEGPNGQLSERQYRLVAHRVILEWALKGERLGRGNRAVLPSCVVWAVRNAFPPPTGEYVGFTPTEIEDLF
ncbi:uncharacterized protein PAE49_022740 [Odontesthes bonariensis]|uniref:uncharacterized protein LOC142371201 n=1 Tax=Odontesthes bonariensis TaxID=219752 RepID=UPI003F5837B9